MPKRIKIEPHLSTEELQRRCRQAKSPTLAHHYQIISLLAQGKSSREVMELTGYSRSWIYEIVWGYNRYGAESLGDHREQNRDYDPILNDVQQAQLWQVLQQPPADGGLWNGRKVADWMSELTGRKISRQRGWEYLKSMKFRRRVPRPEYEATDILEQEKWKKKSPERSGEIGEKISRKRCRSMVNG